MASILFPLYSLAQLALVIWLITIWRNSPLAQVRCACAIVVVVAAGLVYDNALIGLGSQIGVGETLYTLSLPRYVLHALVTPLMLFAIVQLAAAADIKLALHRGFRWLAGIVSVALIPLGIEEVLIDLQLYPACFEGTLRYATSSYANQLCSPDQLTVASGGGPPIPAITATLVVVLMGAMMLWKWRSPWALIGAIIVLVSASLPISEYGPSPGNGAEVFFILGYALTAARFAKGT